MRLLIDVRRNTSFQGRNVCFFHFTQSVDGRLSREVVNHPTTATTSEGCRHGCSLIRILSGPILHDSPFARTRSWTGRVRCKKKLSFSSSEPKKETETLKVKWTAKIGLEGRNVDLCPTRVTQVSKGARCGGNALSINTEKGERN